MILANQFQENGRQEGIPVLGMSERVPILQYANDTMLFLGRSNKVQAKIQSCFTIFSLISGLKINLPKSVIYWVGVDLPCISHLAADLGCQVGNLPVNYLGLPMGKRSLC